MPRGMEGEGMREGAQRVYSMSLCTNDPTRSAMQTPKSRNGQFSEFHIFAPPNSAPAQCRPGHMPPLSPSRRHCSSSSHHYHIRKLSLATTDTEDNYIPQLPVMGSFQIKVLQIMIWNLFDYLWSWFQSMCILMTSILISNHYLMDFKPLFDGFRDWWAIKNQNRKANYANLQ